MQNKLSQKKLKPKLCAMNPKKTSWIQTPVLLTYFMKLVSFYTPRKYQSTSAFLMFSGGIEKDQWR